MKYISICRVLKSCFSTSSPMLFSFFFISSHHLITDTQFKILLLSWILFANQKQKSLRDPFLASPSSLLRSCSGIESEATENSIQGWATFLKDNPTCHGCPTLSHIDTCRQTLIHKQSHTHFHSPKQRDLTIRDNSYTLKSWHQMGCWKSPESGRNSPNLTQHFSFCAKCVPRFWSLQ